MVHKANLEPGLYWHPTPDKLIEFCNDPARLREYYRSWDFKETPILLQLFREVGKRVSKEVDESTQTCIKAYIEYEEWRLRYEEMQITHNEVLFGFDGSTKERAALERFETAHKRVEEAERLGVKGWKAITTCWKALLSALRLFVESLKEDKIRKKYSEASYMRTEKFDAYKDAVEKLREALRKNMGEIEKLHKQECPNCPWDGKTIYPESA